LTPTVGVLALMTGAWRTTGTWLTTGSEGAMRTSALSPSPLVATIAARMAWPTSRSLGTYAATYRPIAADQNHTLRVRVIATNASGDSSPALSAPTGVVT
jgi:hypothetical protein